jgi:hypothetical protein
MMRTRVAVAVLRVLHGLALIFGMLLSGWLLVAVIEARYFRGLRMPRAPEYLFLYSCWLTAHLLLAWCAWPGFSRCSFRRSIAYYGIWLAFFVWHGWFTEWAPFRLHEVLMPGYAGREYARISLEVVLWLTGFGILPALRYPTRPGVQHAPA